MRMYDDYEKLGSRTHSARGALVCLRGIKSGAALTPEQLRSVCTHSGTE
jgi:hypothetical protein